MKEKWVTFFQGDFLVFPFKYKKCCCWDISLLRLCGKQLVAIDTTPTPLRQRISQEERYLQTLCWHELIFTVATKYSWSWTRICVISDDDSISTSVWFGLTKTAHTCHGTSLASPYIQQHHVGCFSFLLSFIDVTMFLRENNILLSLVSALTLILLLAALSGWRVSGNCATLLSCVKELPWASCSVAMLPIHTLEGPLKELHKSSWAAMKTRVNDFVSSCESPGCSSADS